MRKFSGSLQGRVEGTGQVQFCLLLALAALKIFLAIKTFGYAREAAALGAQSGEAVYVRNAFGAKVATVLCGRYARRAGFRGEVGVLS